MIMLQKIVLSLIFGFGPLVLFAQSPSAVSEVLISSQSSVAQQLFSGMDFSKLQMQYSQWEYAQDTSLVGEWKFILYTLDPAAKGDLWWVSTVEEKLSDNGFRNKFDGTEYNVLSISPNVQKTCPGNYSVEVRNILYGGLNQGPHCVYFESETIRFQQFGMTPSLDWKTDAWYGYHCRKKQFKSEYFLLCQVSLGGDWMTGDPNWNERTQKWLGRSFGYFGFWKKKNQ